MPRPSDPHAKTKLIAAAEQIFTSRGLEGAKVEEITLRAGLAKGTFYLHFTSKEDAFREVVETMVGRMAAHLEELPEDCAASACEDVTAFLDRWVAQDAQIFEFIWKDRRLMGLLLEGGKSAAYRHLVDQFADRAAAKVRSMLALGIASGIYRPDLDLDVAASFVAGAYDRLARTIVLQTRRPDLEGMLRKLQFLILRGIASAGLVAQLEGATTGSKPRGSRKRATP